LIFRYKIFLSSTFFVSVVSFFKGEFPKEKKEEKEDDLIGEEGSGDNLPLYYFEFDKIVQDK